MAKKIDVIAQMILAAIPIFATPLYAFYRIKKLKKGVLVILLTLAIVATDSTLHNEVSKSEFFEMESFEREAIVIFSYVSGFIITILLSMYFARKWTLEYNEKIEG